MKRLLLWVAVPLLLLGAAMLIADIGATALWVAVITVGIALVDHRPGQAERDGTTVTLLAEPPTSRAGGAVMKRLLHRVGPAVPIFGPPRSQGTSWLGANGGAVKKRLLRRVGPAVAIFGLIMAVAHIGPTTPWIAVVKVAVALGIFAERWRSPAGMAVAAPGRAAHKRA